MQQTNDVRCWSRPCQSGGVLLIALALSLTGCGEDTQTASGVGSAPAISFSRPAARQLSQTGPVSVEVSLPTRRERAEADAEA